MAAECPLAERRIVEIKMGRSKFPGKPSKIGNRKRVNLSSCALPEENESSKAAENIYLGLSMFNETFGDNEMVPTGPFHGFSVEDMENAMAEARLQQKESEMEHKKQGININLQDSFRNELLSITGCFSLNGNHDKDKTRVCFDGGGINGTKEMVDKLEKNDSKPSLAGKVTSNVKESNNNAGNDIKKKYINANNIRKSCHRIGITNSKRNMYKLPKNINSFKSLQSKAAKRLLDKAKMANISDSNKSNINQRKFILPSYSLHSLRVIKPNKRFIEDVDNKKDRFLKGKSSNNSSPTRSKKLTALKESKLSEVSISNELRIEITDDNGKRTTREESNVEGKCNTGKELNDKLNCSIDSSKTSAPYSSSGKLILREPKLQLNKVNSGLTEGPFSSSSRSSSLSPNSHLNPNPIQTSVMHRTIICGVCGSVIFYKVVELAKKFGIYCCEPCQKFITGIIQLVESDRSQKLQCTKGKGLCLVQPLIKNQHSTTAGMDCQACWLKLCLKNFQMSSKLKTSLSGLLPVEMQFNMSLDPCIVGPMDDSSTFGITSNILKDFRWLNQNESNSNVRKDARSTRPIDSSDTMRDRSSRRFTGSPRFESKRRLLRHKGRVKTFADADTRQRIDLKGPRVKNVCRSASIVLGQPIATFPRDSSPKKNQGNEVSPPESSKTCDKLEGTNACNESQGVPITDKNDENASATEGKQSSTQGERKSGALASKQAATAKPSPGQTIAVGRAKRKGNSKTENPVSIDFWEAYDPEEVCETGFGLIGSENFSVRALCFLCGSSGQEKLIHCASCCEPYHEFCVNEEQVKHQDDIWKYDWVCPRCTICITCGKTSGQQLKCVKCDNSYHMECVDRVGGRLLHSPDRPWVCSVCLRCKSCNGVDVSVFVGNLPLCRACFVLRQKGNYCPLCQRCYEDDDFDSKMMECGQCKCWVHAKCEGLSDEKYQVLSFLPESVEYICRMCCVMPPAPWWIAVEAELKSGYLGVLKALSKNRKACAMLKWSPRKQCTCRQINFTPRALDFDDPKPSKFASEHGQGKGEEVKSSEGDGTVEDKPKEENFRPASVLERKTSIEVINHSTGSLKLTLKIMKGVDGGTGKGEGGDADAEPSCKAKDSYDKSNVKECSTKVKKCPLNEDVESPGNTMDCSEDGQSSLFKSGDFNASSSELPDKRSISSPLNPSSDSGIGSTDDELKANSLTDEESCKTDDQQSSNRVESKGTIEASIPFLEDKNECICFLEVDSYNSRSKPFSPNLLSIKKKVTTSEYSSLQQFHMDMQRMIATTQSTELMEMYHQTVKEIFPWFDPKFSRVYSNSQKVSSSASVESTPAKSSPTRNFFSEDCKVPREKLVGQGSEYYYSGFLLEDVRSCLMCKGVGDGAPNSTGRLLYCGQNEWVHCNCALWSAEVFEEIDGSLQNVHSAINRGRSIRCPECNLKGASIGCCARNCAETFHFLCARKVGCAFMDDKTVYCPAHLHETKGKIFQNEKEFEIRRPVYVELDKRKMKSVDSSQVRFAVGGLHVENLGRFVMKLSDCPEAIIPDQFHCTRLFWSCYEPWKIVRYHFTVRLQEDELDEGVDFGVNLTIDHSEPQDVIDLKLQQLRYFQEHHKLLAIDEGAFEDKGNGKRKLSESKIDGESRFKADEARQVPVKRPKKDSKIVKKIVDLFDPREDESCLSDSQNTADLLPPELEEAIFKDLPNDILDGISMQDIFMDIKTDLYEGGEKDGRETEDSLEVEEMMGTTEQGKMKKMDANGESNPCDIWTPAEDPKQGIYEWTDETPSPKVNRDLKRSRSDIIPSRRNVMLKSNNRSCSLNWNCKMDIHTAKWKRNCKSNASTNLLEPQERGNMLQELKFPEGLVMVSADTMPSVRDLKDRLTAQQEEGKENKCLPWNMRSQPRLLQVDGGADSSSSGSEAGESPQRLIEESLINGRGVARPPQPAPYSANPPYSAGSVPAPSLECPYSLPKSFNLPQIDGVFDDSSSDDGGDVDSDRVKSFVSFVDYKIPQLDGSADSESEAKNSCDLGRSPEYNSAKDEPVKCNQCRCTYRTKQSYDRHLETCCNDYILFSSDGEGSEEESPFHQGRAEEQAEEASVSVKMEPSCSDSPESRCERPADDVLKKVKVEASSPKEKIPVKVEVKAEVKKEKAKNGASDKTKSSPPKPKKAQVKRKALPPVKNTPLMPNSQNISQILVQQNAVPSAVIVQDIAQPNIVPGAFINPGHTIQYITSLESQGAFAKAQPQLIATPSPLVPGGFHIQAQDSQLIPSLPVLSQGVQTNLPGIIIQQPQMTGTLISPAPQPASVVVSGDQMVLGAAPVLEVIHDPHTGGMYLASHNQPVFYNMETIVSNTVMQTNQFVSNVMTASSFSQTSTQVVQTSRLEQVMNVPSNFILVGPNSASDKILPSGDLICLPAAQPLITSPATVQTVVNPIIQASQPLRTEPKVIPMNPTNPPVRCIQPLPPKKPSPQPIASKLPSVHPVVRPKVPEVPIAQCHSKQPSNKQSHFKSMPMMRPNVTKSPPRHYEKAVIVPKTQKASPRAIVEYINNFKSENCELSPTLRKSFAKDEKWLQKNEAVVKRESVSVEKMEVPPAKTSPVRPLSAIKTSPLPLLPKVPPLPPLSPTKSPSAPLPPLLPKKTSPAPPPLPMKTSSVPPPSPPKMLPVATPPLPMACSVRLPSLTEPFPQIPAENSSSKVEELPLLKEDVKNQKKPAPADKEKEDTDPPPKKLPEPTLQRGELMDVDMPVKKVEKEHDEEEEGCAPEELDIEIEPEPDPKGEPKTPTERRKEPLEAKNGEDAVDVDPRESDGKENSSKGDSPTSQVLPLQETSPSANNTPSGIAAKVADSKAETLREKTQFMSSNENCVTKKLVTIHPRLIQNPGSDNEGESENKKRPQLNGKIDEKGPKLIFDVTSDDGFRSSSTSMAELWAKICDSVQEMRAVFKIPPLPISRKGHEILGMQNHRLQHCLEQLRGVEHCVRYKCKYFVKERNQKGTEDGVMPVKENLSGCARTETFCDRKEYDMFAWLASRHRRLPKISETPEEVLSSARRANSLPMAMRYRHLRETAKTYVGVYRSKIHGKGLFCLREIEAGEMVIEYAGEVIRSNITDKREKYYTDKGIGCYMFRIDDHFVVDATMKGNAARFINHSCEPNCYSRVVDILGKKHIVIFALRRIHVMEELTYDYKFPFEDEKISCHCLSKKCRKYLN